MLPNSLYLSLLLISDKIHNYLAGSLVAGDSVFKMKDIDRVNRKIDFGLYGTKQFWLNPKQILILSILRKYFKYQFTQSEISFTFNNPYYGKADE